MNVHALRPTVTAQPVRKKTFGKAKPLQLTFEDLLAASLARICKNHDVPVWTNGGFQVTSVNDVCRVMRLSSLRDYVCVTRAIEASEGEYGYFTQDHYAECDETLTGVYLDRSKTKDPTAETPCIYLDKVEEVLKLVLPRKGPKVLKEYRARIAQA